MRRKRCRHEWNDPCTCALGHMYRFVEPVILMLLKKKGQSYGYDLSNELEDHAITDGLIERAALYRTLRALECNGNVISHWQLPSLGRARRVYRLTPAGEKHLQDWVGVLGFLAKSMERFTAEARLALASEPVARGRAIPAPKERPASAE